VTARAMGGFTSCSLCNANSNTSLNVLFHRPTTSTRRKRWLKVVKDAGIAVKHKASLIVCSLHFCKESSYIFKAEQDKKVLSEYALPTIFNSETIVGLQYELQQVRLLRMDNFFLNIVS
jgi:THAP domain